MATALSIIGALLLLTVLVVAHEYGHFIVGKKLKFKIMEFGVGFGPKLVKWVKDGILYSIRALPIGGFTLFYGEDKEVEDKWAFNKQPVGKRALVIAAGPIMNIILAWLLAVIFLCAFGDYTPYIKDVMPNTPAQQAGLAAGDQVVAINGNRIDFYSELAEYLQGGFDSPPTFTVNRGGKEITFKNIETFFSKENNKKMIGITFDYNKKYFGFFEAVGLSFKWMFITIKLMLSFLFGLIFAGKGATTVLGPVGTIQVIGLAIRSSLETVVQLGALISVNLAVINLLPFPALDGGRLIFLAIEKIRRKPLPKNAEGYLNFAGFVALMGLMVILTVQDIGRMIS